MECGTTTQSAAINEGMQGRAESEAETAAQMILCNKAGVPGGELNKLLCKRRSIVLSVGTRTDLQFFYA